MTKDATLGSRGNELVPRGHDYIRLSNLLKLTNHFMQVHCVAIPLKRESEQKTDDLLGRALLCLYGCITFTIIRIYNLYCHV